MGQRKKHEESTRIRTHVDLFFCLIFLPSHSVHCWHTPLPFHRNITHYVGPSIRSQLGMYTVRPAATSASKQASRPVNHTLTISHVRRLHAAANLLRFSALSAGKKGCGTNHLCVASRCGPRTVAGTSAAAASPANTNKNSTFPSSPYCKEHQQRRKKKRG